jgi:hypothetical protein
MKRFGNQRGIILVMFRIPGAFLFYPAQIRGILAFSYGPVVIACGLTC